MNVSRKNAHLSRSVLLSVLQVSLSQAHNGKNCSKMLIAHPFSFRVNAMMDIGVQI